MDADPQLPTTLMPIAQFADALRAVADRAVQGRIVLGAARMTTRDVRTLDRP